MNIPAKLIRLLPILFILLLACQTEDEPFLEVDPDLLEVQNIIANAEERFIDPSARVSSDITICGEEKEYPLMWYLSRDVGYITVSNSNDYLIVNMKLDPGFYFKKTDLIIKVRKESNTAYYNYVYPVSHDDGIQEYTYLIPISDLKSAPDHIILTATIMAWKEGELKPSKMINVLAKDVSLERKRFLIEYYFQNCDPVDTSCPVACEFGIGIPSVDIAKSYTFEDLGITDWPWGYVHEIKDEMMFRLPIKSEDTETAAIIGQVTIMLENGTAYVYFQINDGLALNKTMLYIGAELPDSGIPCNYNFSREYENSILTDNYEISNIDDFRDSNGKFYIITYVDYCES